MRLNKQKTMGAVFALISNASAISFDINYNPEGPAHFVN